MVSKKQDKSKRVIILIGPPGSGKGTQAYILDERLPNSFYFETSKIIEANVMEAKEGDVVVIGGKKYSLAHERKLWKTGILCTPEVVSFWVKEKFRELAAEERGLVIAGSPRTLHEGEEVMPVLEKLYGKQHISIIELTLSAEQSIWRNSHRRICALFRHPILYTEETKRLTKCPIDGSKLLKRRGLDDPKTVKVRLKEYALRTKPLLQFFKTKGYKVKKINGEQTPEEVANDILQAV